MKYEPQRIGDKLVVRVRKTSEPMGPFRLNLYVLTPPRSRGHIGPRHFTPEMAREYARGQGWTVLGSQG